MKLPSLWRSEEWISDELTELGPWTSIVILSWKSPGILSQKICVNPHSQPPLPPPQVLTTRDDSVCVHLCVCTCVCAHVCVCVCVYVLEHAHAFSFMIVKPSDQVMNLYCHKNNSLISVLSFFFICDFIQGGFTWVCGCTQRAGLCECN